MKPNFNKLPQTKATNNTLQNQQIQYKTPFNLPKNGLSNFMMIPVFQKHGMKPQNTTMQNPTFYQKQKIAGTQKGSFGRTVSPQIINSQVLKPGIQSFQSLHEMQNRQGVSTKFPIKYPVKQVRNVMQRPQMGNTKKINFTTGDKPKSNLFKFSTTNAIKMGNIPFSRQQLLVNNGVSFTNNLAMQQLGNQNKTRVVRKKITGVKRTFMETFDNCFDQYQKNFPSKKRKIEGEKKEQTMGTPTQPKIEENKKAKTKENILEEKFEFLCRLVGLQATKIKQLEDKLSKMEKILPNYGKFK